MLVVSLLVMVVSVLCFAVCEVVVINAFFVNVIYFHYYFLRLFFCGLDSVLLKGKVLASRNPRLINKAEQPDGISPLSYWREVGDLYL